ncbi:MAG: hypothetical protein WD314_05870 [Trueperaceae bacterium]
MINVNLLPKNLRRVQEPGYWKLLAVLFPLLAFAIVFTLQFTANQTVRNLEHDVQQLEDRLALLQPALREQQQLQQRQAQLRQLIRVYEQVRANRIEWSSAITGMLENLPALNAAGSRQIDFRSLNLTASVPPINDPARYEGRTVVAEMSVSGNTVDTDVLADFIRAVEDSSSYGVAFQRTDRQEDRGIYGYSLVVGMYQGDQNEAR